MSTNNNLNKAKNTKNNEYYTQYCDISLEIKTYLKHTPDLFRDKTVLCPCDDYEKSNFAKFFIDNFHILGLEKLICTCYCISNIRQSKYGASMNLFDSLETLEAQMNKVGSNDGQGKLFIMTRRGKKHHNIFKGYLEGDGDFKSQEVTQILRGEADFVITNPPFSLFREFMAWLKTNGTDVKPWFKYSVIGSINAITYKEVFPYLKNNTMYAKCTGETTHHGMWFITNDIENNPPLEDTNYSILEDNLETLYVPSYWYTNIEYDSRHRRLELKTMEENIQSSKHKDIRGHEYQKYDNFDAIEVPHVDAIPKDYKGLMGVPVTFFDKYCPEQFEIIGNFNPHSKYDIEEDLCYVDSSMTEALTIEGKITHTNGAVVNKQPKFKRVIIKNKI